MSEQHSDDSRGRIDELCTHFEAAWKSYLAGEGDRPEIEQYLQPTGADQEKLFEELLLVELAIQRKQGEEPQMAAYQQRFPEHNELVQQVFDPAENTPADSQLTESVHAGQKSGKTLPGSIGPYKVLQEIGEGAMGTVYMAEQTSPVRRRVALKVIKAGLDTSQVVARFEAERQALAMMGHQNIAKVLDVGVTDDGRPYFAMELVQGIPITKYCDKNKLSLNDRLELLGQVCRAIQHSHQQGVIHRDLKPSNVLVTLYDGVPAAKVIDFGLAKALQSQTRLTDKTLFTEFGQVVGTLEYMSPEQAEMNELSVDTRTDVYSLGVMLYELLTGSTPLEKKRIDEEEGNLLRVLELIREEEVPRPSSRLSDSGGAITGISKQRQIEPRRLSLILKRELDWIAMKALEKDRARRYEGAGALADDVQRYLDHEAIEARPPSVSYRLQKTIRKHKGAFATGTAIVTLLIVGLIGIGTMWLRAEDAREKAVAAQQAEAKQRKKATEEAQKARESEAKATQRLNDLRSQAAHSAFANGLRLCEQQRIRAGLLWFAKSLELGTDNQDVRKVTLENIFNWGQRVAQESYSNHQSLQWPGIKKLSHKGDSVVWLTYTAKGSSLVTATSGGDIRLWDSDSGTERCQHSLGTQVLAACYDRTSNCVYVAGLNKTLTSIQLINMESHWKVETVQPKGLSSPVLAMEFAATDQKLVLGGSNGSVSYYDVKKQTLEWLCGAGESRVADVAINPAGSLVIAGFQDGTVRIWDRVGGNELLKPYRHGGPVHDVAVHPDGQFTASAGMDRKAVLARIKDGQVAQAKYLTHHCAVTSVTFVPNSDSLLTGCEDHSAKLWDVPTFKQQGVPFHPDFVQTPGYSEFLRRLEHERSIVKTVYRSPVPGERTRVEKPIPEESVRYQYLASAAISDSDDFILISGSHNDRATTRIWNARLHKPTGPLGIWVPEPTGTFSVPINWKQKKPTAPDSTNWKQKNPIEWLTFNLVNSSSEGAVALSLLPERNPAPDPQNKAGEQTNVSFKSDPLNDDELNNLKKKLKQLTLDLERLSTQEKTDNPSQEIPALPGVNSSGSKYLTTEFHFPASLHPKGSQFAVFDSNDTVFLLPIWRSSVDDVSLLRKWVTVLTGQSLQPDGSIELLDYDMWQRHFDDFQKSASTDLPMPKQISELIALKRMQLNLGFAGIQKVEGFVKRLSLMYCNVDNLTQLAVFSRLEVLSVYRFVNDDARSLREIADRLGDLDSLKTLILESGIEDDRAIRIRSYLQQALPELKIDIEAPKSPGTRSSPEVIGDLPILTRPPNLPARDHLLK